MEEKEKVYQEVVYVPKIELQFTNEKILDDDEKSKEDLYSHTARDLRKALQHVDILLSIFIAFKSISIFFPIPLEMVRPETLTIITQTLFGESSVLVGLFAVITWWGIEYFSDLSGKLKNFMKMGISISPWFKRTRKDLLIGKCQEISSLAKQIAVDSIAIQVIPSLIVRLGNCGNCNFSNLTSSETIEIPYSVAKDGFQTIGVCEKDCGVNTKFSINTYSETQAQSLFEKSVIDRSIPKNVLGAGLVPLPRRDMPFLGNDKICFDPNYAKGHYINPVQFSNWDAWMETGILAVLCIRLSIAFLGYWLFRLADPFSTCGGKHLCPPKQYVLVEEDGCDSPEELKNKTEKALRKIALKQIIIYTIITNAALLNLIIVVARNKDRDKTKDSLYLGVTLTFAFVLPLVAACYLNRDKLLNRENWKLICERLMFWKKRPTESLPSSGFFSRIRAKSPLGTRDTEQKDEESKEDGLLGKWGFKSKTTFKENKSSSTSKKAKVKTEVTHLLPSHKGQGASNDPMSSRSKNSKGKSNVVSFSVDDSTSNVQMTPLPRKDRREKDIKAIASVENSVPRLKTPLVGHCWIHPPLNLNLNLNLKAAVKKEMWEMCHQVSYHQVWSF